MGQAFDELAVGVLTFILVVPLSITGTILSIKQHRLAAIYLSFIGIVLGIIPLPLGIWLGHKIIAVTGVILEP